MLCQELALLTLSLVPAQEPARAARLTFIRERLADLFDFEYTHGDDPYLATVREPYDLDQVARGAATEIDQLRMISSPSRMLEPKATWQ